MNLQFSETMDCIIRYVTAPDETELVIPEGVRMIMPYAFSNSPNLISVQLPATLQEIHDEVFRNCQNLQKLVLPDCEVYISEDAFSRCGIQKLIIPAEFLTLLPDSRRHCEPLPELPPDDSPEHIPTKWDSLYDLEEFDKYLYERELRDAEWWEVENEAYYSGVYGIPVKFNCDSWPAHAAPYKGMQFIAGIEHLQSITVSEENPFYADFDGVLFDKSLQSLLAVPPAKTTLRIPRTCKKLKISFNPEHFRFYYDYMEREALEYSNDKYSYVVQRHDKLGSHQLSEIMVEDENRYFTAFDGALYDKSLSSLIAVPRKKQFIQFPDSLTKVEHFAFFNSEIPEIFISEQVSLIENEAFPEKMIIHFLCQDRTISVRIPEDVSWETEADGNWKLLKVIRAETPEICLNLFQQLAEPYQHQLILDMCERWTEFRPFHDILVGMGEKLLKNFVKKNRIPELKRLLHLNSVSEKVASFWFSKANQMKRYEAQILLMHYLSRISPADNIKEINSWLNLD